MLKFLTHALVLCLLVGCGELSWTDVHVQNGMTTCADALNSIPCDPSVVTDIDGDGLQDENCGLGEETEDACECLIDEVQAAVTPEEFTQVMSTNDKVLNDCGAAAAMMAAVETCLADIPCPPGATVDGEPVTDCGVQLEQPITCQ